MDEKGFMLGILQASKRYFTAAELKSGRLRGIGQDGSREWVTIVASVCQDLTFLPPAIIYSAATNNHQDSWYEDLSTCEPIAHFITSPNGWTNNNIGYEWLTEVFDRHTKKKARNGNAYRLLFIDGHSSHLNMRFIDFCDKNKILLLAYPPHSTHRLQPLDVSLFNPLANFYSQNLDEWLLKSYGVCSMSKRHFWRLFKAAFDKAFTEENIASGWKKTGLYPLNQEAILSQVRLSEPRPTSSSASSASAFSSSSWRRANQHLRDTYGPALTRAEKKLVNTIDHLCTKAQHQEIKIELLEERLQLQEKHHKRSQTLFSELRAQSDTKAIFFSPNKVQEAKDLRAKREREKEEEEDRKRLQRTVRQEAKERRAAELAEKRAQKAIARLNREQQLAEARLQREEARLQKQAERQLLSDSKPVRKQEKGPRQKSVRFEPDVVTKSVVPSPTVQEPGPSSSRPQRRLPQRYRN
jgi:hypothetical protein